MNPKVSVLLPVYNGEPYLGEAIQSILSQKYRDFEFLIVDDGSTDRSKETIRKYKDPRINFIDLSVNSGLVAALNTGLSIARGEYVVRMDQDDIALPMRIARQVDFMEANPHVGVAGSWVLAIGEWGKRRIITETKDRMLRAKLFFANQLIHPSVIMRMAVLNKYNLRYDPDYCHSEDYKMWLNISKHAQLANIPKVLLKYRMHPAQTCQGFHQDQRGNLARVAGQLCAELGIAVSAPKLALHCALGFGEFYSGLKEVEEWFLQLQEANAETKIYPQEVFLLALAEQWAQVCIGKGNLVYWMKKALFHADRKSFLALNYALPGGWRVLRGHGLSWMIRQLGSRLIGKKRSYE